MSTPEDPWSDLRRHTAARIALGRAGVSLPTREWLAFSWAHAQARDAVHLPLDSAAVAQALAHEGFSEVLQLHSAAPDRASFLRRPDLGRQLSASSQALLANQPKAPGRLAVIVGDGLSARAIHAHAVPLLRALRPLLEEAQLPIACIALVQQCRVALGDAVGGMLGSAAALVLIGERPGLSSPDSLGAYLSWAPGPGKTDAQRNCVSNIRPRGLSYQQAAYKIGWLLSAARRLGATGVALKDESEIAGGSVLASATSPPLVAP